MDAQALRDRGKKRIMVPIIFGFVFSTLFTFAVSLLAPAYLAMASGLAFLGEALVIVVSIVLGMKDIRAARALTPPTPEDADVDAAEAALLAAIDDDEEDDEVLDAGIVELSPSPLPWENH